MWPWQRPLCCNEKQNDTATANFVTGSTVAVTALVYVVYVVLACPNGLQFSTNTDHREHCVTHVQRKQHRPGIASSDNTMHVPTARSSADPTKPNHTPTRHTRAKDKTILQMATPHAESSQRTHVSRTQGRGRTHPVNRRVATQYPHTQSVTTRRRCGRNDNQESPRDLSAHRANGIAADQAESKVSGAAGG